MTPEEQIENLKKEVEYWKSQYHKAKDEVEKLALDLGLRDYPQFHIPPFGEENALREQTQTIQKRMETTAGKK